MHLRKEQVTRTGVCDMYVAIMIPAVTIIGGVGWGVGSCFLFVSVPYLKP